jgi:hypothetical protein
MPTRVRRTRIAVLGASVVLLLATRPAASVVADEKPAAPCCFTNPQYSGVCQVQPAEGESCSSILAYLNKPMSSGKSYCSSTEIRGGWARVKCE